MVRTCLEKDIRMQWMWLSAMECVCLQCDSLLEEHCSSCLCVHRAEEERQSRRL